MDHAASLHSASLFILGAIMLGSKTFSRGQRVCSSTHAPVCSSRIQQNRLLVTARAGLPGVGMIGTKAGMTQVYTEEGLCYAASVISLDEGNIVTQVS